LPLFFYCSHIETLTFLFTDIEGSTTMHTRGGAENFVKALADHHAAMGVATARLPRFSSQPTPETLPCWDGFVNGILTLQRRVRSRTRAGC
jgi:hypothetical protein